MSRRYVPPALCRPRSDEQLWQACCEGREPAESLDPRDREDLVAALVGWGWRDVQIATHTRMSTYTTARIRERIGLEAAPMVPAASPPARTTSRPPTAPHERKIA